MTSQLCMKMKIKQLGGEMHFLTSRVASLQVGPRVALELNWAPDNRHQGFFLDEMESSKGGLCGFTSPFIFLPSPNCPHTLRYTVSTHTTLSRTMVPFIFKDANKVYVKAKLPALSGSSAHNWDLRPAFRPLLRSSINISCKLYKETLKYIGYTVWTTL